MKKYILFTGILLLITSCGTQVDTDTDLGIDENETIVDQSEVSNELTPEENELIESLLLGTE